MKEKTDYGYKNKKMPSLLMTPPEDNKIYRQQAVQKAQIYIIFV